MAEQTTPETAVSQEAPDSSLESLLESQFSTEQPAKIELDPLETTEVETSPSDQASEEVTPDDIPAEQSDGEAFEIVHNGQQHKLTRAETIRLAQQGFDYTQKTQAVAETVKEVQQRLQRVQALEQLQPQLAQEAAQVAALEAQLKPYQNVDWVQVATQDPIEYSRHRASYDVLVNNYQQAVARMNQKQQHVTQERQALDQQSLQQEMLKLTQAVPEWSDPAKFRQGSQELRAYLLKQGADPQAVDGLRDSVSVSIARKAMLYDRLVDAKAAKVKELRTAPPVIKPGTVRPESGKAEFNKFRQDFNKAGQRGNSRAQEEALEKVLSRTFK